MPPLQVVERVDVVGDGCNGGSARGVVLVVDELGLQRPEETLGNRIVPAIAGATHARHDAAAATHITIVLARVRTSTIGVMHEARLRFAAFESTPQCC